ncbi:PREDICTED: lateral signaling target protein 2 homolog isoform X1 [Ficedula albicollis]|uniref:lateral signaling target protein 2 homolog isoform X1 n=1 Tax=Ficedula albicollis TaxID=59894 RepID=UPI0007AD7DD5|nr:PREDICTED: lateral signaling target protein 2 homolog isoform X1 [Ficedula albicollis]
MRGAPTITPLLFPQRSDPRLLSQFFFADERVTRVVAEINGLDAELDPQQYLVLLNQLHLSQAHLLAVLERIMEECIPTQRHSRDYLVKFPEELLVDNLGNHMLFAAECLLAGTFLEMEESEGAQLRPQARNLLCSLELVRTVLREQSLSQPNSYPEPVRAVLIQFDRLFAEFELSYVSSLVAVKSPDEIYRQQEIIVLFCETVERALHLGYLTQEMIDGYEPLLMFTIPRLAIISGLLIYPEGPLSLERRPEEMSRVFSPFYNLLKKIRDLLWVLSAEELCLLERSLCTAEQEDPCSPDASPAWGAAVPSADPPAPFNVLEVPNATQPPSTCTTRLGPPSAADDLSTDWQQGCAVGRQQGQEGKSLPTGTGISHTIPGMMVTSPLCSPQPLGSSPGMGVDATPSARCSELRSRYSSTKDMLHTLFVCISGVADQLQTNFASDMRSILKTVFKIVCSKAEPSEEQRDSKEKDGDSCVTHAPRVADCPLCSSPAEAAGFRRAAGARHLPEWVPDSTCSQCSACRSPFTLLRRRHHCRSCGKPLSALPADLLCPLLTEYRSAAPLRPDQTRACLHPLLHRTPAAHIPLCPEPVRAPLPALLPRRLHNRVPRAALGLPGSTSAP